MHQVVQTQDPMQQTADREPKHKMHRAQTMHKAQAIRRTHAMLSPQTNPDLTNTNKL